MKIVKEQSCRIVAMSAPMYDEDGSWTAAESMRPGDDALFILDEAARLCYASEPRTPGDIPEMYKFIADKVARGHHSIIEHVHATVVAVTDRGVTHEWVRHRLANYSQQSTRYCNYSKGKFGGEISVILPVEFREVHALAEAHGGFGKLRVLHGASAFGKWASAVGACSDDLMDRMRQYATWYIGCMDAEEAYMTMLEAKAQPQLARAVLPNSTMTVIMSTMNMRELRHFFTLRDHAAAHPQMQDIAGRVHTMFKSNVPVLFDGLPTTFEGECCG